MHERTQHNVINFFRPPPPPPHTHTQPEDVMERIVDPSSSSDVRQLTGHSGPVYSTSFNPDNTFLLSGSEDGTGKSHDYQLVVIVM